MDISFLVYFLSFFIALPIVVLSLMLVFGGPSDPAKEDNEDKLAIDNSPTDALNKYYTASDGTVLAYREYLSLDVITHSTVILLHGISASSASLDLLARSLSASGVHVVSPDIRGHGESGEHGVISYIGQLEDDLVDLVKFLDFKSQTTLIGFSAGGGLALRFAGSSSQQIFSKYLLLAPFISHSSPTNRDGVSTRKIGLLRIVALSILNRCGFKAFNKITVLKTSSQVAGPYLRTTSYSFSLMMNFRPKFDYIENMKSITQSIAIAVGSEDQQFHANEFSAVFKQAGFNDVVSVLPGLDHEDMIFDNKSHRWIKQQLSA